MASNDSHPYVPADIVLHGYTPLSLPFHTILFAFFGGSAVVMAGMWLLTGRFKYLSTVERLWACWWLCTGSIHFFIEGNVVLNPKFYQDDSGHIITEIWKEYTKADSRYATRDAFTIQMEAITAFAWGPLCYLIVFGILYRQAFRYAAMLVVATGQLYGVTLYYLTCYHVGFSIHSRPEPLYFWGYFVAANAIWVVVPSMSIIYAGRAVNAAIASAGGTRTSKKKKL